MCAKILAYSPEQEESKARTTELSCHAGSTSQAVFKSLLLARSDVALLFYPGISLVRILTLVDIPGLSAVLACLNVAIVVLLVALLKKKSGRILQLGRVDCLLACHLLELALTRCACQSRIAASLSRLSDLSKAPTIAIQLAQRQDRRQQSEFFKPSHQAREDKSSRPHLCLPVGRSCCSPHTHTLSMYDMTAPPPQSFSSKMSSFFRSLNCCGGSADDDSRSMIIVSLPSISRSQSPPD
jgi:hypothetical protein